jgi:hypothetical protein
VGKIIHYNFSMSRKPTRVSPRQDDAHRSYTGIQELLEAETGLAGYNLDIVKKFAHGLGITSGAVEPNLKLVDFGAGSGSLAEIWRRLIGAEPICIEIDPTLAGILKAKNFETYSSVNDLESEITALYSSNVLEHIEDDVAALKAIQAKMVPNGRLVLHVPAHPFLFSELDTYAGHFRRYRKFELEQKVMQAGFEIEKCFYNDSIGVLASLALKILGYKSTLGLGSNASLTIYDRVVYPISRIFDQLLFKNVTGKNLFILAVNPAKHA